MTARRSSAIVGQQVARLEKLGAKVVSRLRRWVVMEAPTGQRFCVVRVQRPCFQRMLTAGTKSDLLSAEWETRTLPTQVTIVTSSPSSRSRRTVPAFQTLAPGTWNGRSVGRGAIGLGRIPTARQAPSRVEDARKRADGPTLLLESFDEPFEQPRPDFVLADLVLDAVLEVGVVVDLHDNKAVVGLLDVDAVEPLADRPRRAHRDVDQLGWRVAELEGAEAALARGAVGAVLDDLPVAGRLKGVYARRKGRSRPSSRAMAGYAVLAHEQRLADEHADPPVELGRQEFLRQQEIGLLEQLVGDAAELLR